MSQLRRKARQVMEAGAEKRRNWNPSPNSGHYRIYRWWLRQSQQHIARENFCHYVRVVIFWAPLRAIYKPLLAFLGGVAAFEIIELIVTHFGAVVGTVAAIATITYIVFGSRVFLHVSVKINSELPGKEWAWLDTKKNTITAGLVLMTLPVFIVWSILAVTLGSLFVFLMSLQEDYELYSKIGQWLGHATFSDRKSLSWIRPWLIFPIALITCSIVFDFYFTLINVVLAINTVFFPFILVSYLGDRSKQKRLQQEEQEQLAINKAIADIVLERLFTLLHPEWVGDEQRFNRWLERYKAYCIRTTGEEYNLWPHHKHMEHVARKYRATYGHEVHHIGWKVRTSGYVTHVRVEEPEQKRRFVRTKLVATTAWDTFVLLWSVVLVKKWRMCPFVELPE